MISINPQDLTTAKLHSYLLSSVAPRPIAFASTIDAEGHPNLSPFSYFNVFSTNPPILIFSPARRVRDNTVKHTLVNAEAVKEVVINVVNYDLVHQMSLTSTEYPEGGAGNLIVCEVVKIHITEEVINGDGSINQEALDLVARAGGSYYSRAKKGFFEIPKPLKTMGIGVDAMPEHVKNSMILTGNNLGMLANVERLPSQKAVSEFIAHLSERYPNIKEASHRKKHKLAQNYLSFGDVESAWKLLLS